MYLFWVLYVCTMNIVYTCIYRHLHTEKSSCMYMSQSLFYLLITMYNRMNNDLAYKIVVQTLNECTCTFHQYIYMCMLWDSVMVWGDKSIVAHIDKSFVLWTLEWLADFLSIEAKEEPNSWQHHHHTPKQIGPPNCTVKRNCCNTRCVYTCTYVMGGVSTDVLEGAVHNKKLLYKCTHIYVHEEKTCRMFFCTFFGLYTFETESHLVCQLPEADPQYKVSYTINRSSFDGTCI